MRKILNILLIGMLILTSSCIRRKCHIPKEPYTSTMSGEKSLGLRFYLTHLTGIDEGCNGWFIREVFNDTVGNEFNKFELQAVEGLPDHLKEWRNYHEKEFIVDFEFIGIGYECAYDDGLTEWVVPVSPSPVELIKITKIEEAP